MGAPLLSRAPRSTVTVAGKWFVTPHAIARYRQRHRPDISDRQALFELTLWSEVAQQTGRLRSGEYEWHAEHPIKIRFVVSHSPHPNGDLPQLVTVLPGKRPTWIDLPSDIEREFASLQLPAPWSDTADQALMLRWLAERRAQYAAERRDDTATYRSILARANNRSRKRWQERGSELAAQERERHRQHRAEMVALRECKKCGGPVTPRKGRGPTPVFCSVQCSHKAAGLAYYYRNKKAKRAT